MVACSDTGSRDHRLLSLYRFILLKASFPRNIFTIIYRYFNRLIVDGKSMADSASLKVDRATKHIAELNEVLRKTRPFVLVVETNTQTGKRLLRTKKNEAAIGAIAIICGDVVHNLRSAIDHAYWEIISPHCTDDKERHRVQFPFTRKASEWHKTLHNAHAQRAGTGFYCAMRNLRTHGEQGGNKMLWLVREADNLDKHRLLIPAVNYTKVSIDQLSAAVPDMPHIRPDSKLPPQASRIFLAFNDANFAWTNRSVPPDQLGPLVVPSTCLFERELNVPVEIVLKIGSAVDGYPMVSTLHQMRDAVGKTVSLIRESASTY
jgi:hypothetical protein